MSLFVLQSCTLCNKPLCDPPSHQQPKEWKTGYKHPPPMLMHCHCITNAITCPKRLLQSIRLLQFLGEDAVSVQRNFFVPAHRHMRMPPTCKSLTQFLHAGLTTPTVMALSLCSSVSVSLFLLLTLLELLGVSLLQTAAMITVID